MTCATLMVVVVMLAGGDPCPVVERARESWDKAEWFRRMYVNVLRGRDYEPLPFGAVPLRIIQEPVPFAADGRLNWAHTSRVFGTYIIRYVPTKEVELDLLDHEFRHANCLAMESEWADCTQIGHGTAADPWFRMLKELVKWGYPAEWLRPTLEPRN